ncbi:Uncharacterised protein [uncultured archaeon]|nr:Uncharacterised protein [uncultured archaeon]
MPGQETASEKKESSSSSEKKLFAILSLITMDPVGNPLLTMTGVQRQFFFESLLRNMHVQQVENRARTGALLGKTIPNGVAIGAGSQLFARKEGGKLSANEALEAARKEKGKDAAKDELSSDEKGKDFAVATPIAERKAMEEHAASPLGGLAGSAAGMSIIPLAAGASLKNNPSALFSALYGKKTAEAKHARDQLCIALDDYARGDESKAKAAVADFKLRLSMDDYKADELMAVLLLVIEDHVWAEQEGGLLGAKPSGTGAKVKSMIPTQLRETMKESANVRLASVREMLRYYFDRHPKEYAAALAAALGITADQEEDSTYLQERLASELASIGSFALAQKILAEIKLRKKMDTKNCLRELGYRYDRRGKKLILGKRTCGSPAEAKGIIGVLMGGFRHEGEPGK